MKTEPKLEHLSVSPPVSVSQVSGYLEVVLPVHVQPVAEHVPHDQQIGVLALHRHSVHGQEVRQQRAAVAGDHVLEEERSADE